VLTGNLQLNFNRILDTLIDLAEFYGLNPKFRRAANCTYLDALDDPTGTEFTLEEENINEITQTYNSDQRVHALIGKGYGSRDVQQLWAPSDHTWKGVWIEDTIDIDEGFYDTIGYLKPCVRAEYNSRLEDEMFTIVPTPDWGYFPQCYDVVRLKLKGEAERALYVASTKIDSNGKYEMEIGGRDNDLMDAFNGKSSLDRVYANEYLVECGKAITLSGEDAQMGDLTHGICGGIGGYVTIPASVYAADWSHRVTLDLSITTDQPPIDCMFYVNVGGSFTTLGHSKHHLLGDSIQCLDVTRFCNYGSATRIDVWIVGDGDWPGANCAAHPTFDLNVTVRCWKRTILGESVNQSIQRQAVRYASWGAIARHAAKYGR